MAYTYSRISTRIDTSTPFWDIDPETLSLIKSLYDDTGRRISFNVTLSPDLLTETRSHTWATVEDWQHYTTTFFSQWDIRDAYNAANNIVSERIEQ